MGRRNASIRLGPIQPDGRNYGVDLLRVVAMFYVVVLHCLGPGGILDAAAAGSATYRVVWMMEAWTFEAVDIFALISGYVSYSDKDRRTSWTNYVMLWLQVVFYGVVVTLAFNCFRPDLITKKDLLLTLLPVTNGLYWYVCAYTGLFVVMPLLDAGLRKCSEQTGRKLFLGLFLVFSVYEVGVRELDLGNGYTFVWITILYLMGGLVRKCGIGKRLTFGQTVIGVVALWLLAWLWKMVGVTAYLGGISITNGLLISYISPAVVGMALLHLIGFSKLRFGSGMRRVIAFAAPAAFAVYLLNCHRIIWAHVVTGKFVSLADGPAYVMVICVLAFSAVFLVVGILVDRLRILLFDLFRVRKIVDRAVCAAERIVTKLADRL